MTENNEYKDLKELNDTLLTTVKELAKLQESKCDTCCKYITISVIAIALCVTIVLCCIFGQGYSQCSNIKCIPDTTNVQVEVKKGD